jgi:flagellar biosynthesis/type III secretory pathway M-ring protein FliF/YscJ
MKPWTLRGGSADGRVDLMKTNTAKKPAVKTAPAKKVPWTFQQFFDKWLLPVLFVGIGSLIAWAIWRH